MRAAYADPLAYQSDHDSDYDPWDNPFVSPTVRRTLTRELPSAAQVRAMLEPPPAPPPPAAPPLLLKTTRGFEDAADAEVVALSRAKAGRSLKVSQLYGDVLLRVPGPEHACAFCLETVEGGRRFRLEILKADLASVYTKEHVPEASRQAEARWECRGCGRRFGCEAHYVQHIEAPCGQKGLPKKKKKPAAAPAAAPAEGGDDDFVDAPPKKKPRLAKTSTARVALKPGAPAGWKVETAAALELLDRNDTFAGGAADWAPCAPDRDPLKGEAERVGVLTFRPRGGVNLAKLFAPLVKLTEKAAPAPEPMDVASAEAGAAEALAAPAEALGPPQ